MATPKKRTTITFQPTDEVRVLMAARFGDERGLRSRFINDMIRAGFKAMNRKRARIIRNAMKAAASGKKGVKR